MCSAGFAFGNLSTPQSSAAASGASAAPTFGLVASPALGAPASAAATSTPTPAASAGASALAVASSAAAASSPAPAAAPAPQIPSEIKVWLDKP